MWLLFWFVGIYFNWFIKKELLKLNKFYDQLYASYLEKNSVFLSKYSKNSSLVDSGLSTLQTVEF